MSKKYNFFKTLFFSQWTIPKVNTTECIIPSLTDLYWTASTHHNVEHMLYLSGNMDQDTLYSIWEREIYKNNTTAVKVLCSIVAPHFYTYGLINAARYGHVDVIKVLSEYTNPSDNQSYALYSCMREETWECAKFLAPRSNLNYLDMAFYFARLSVRMNDVDMFVYALDQINDFNRLRLLLQSENKSGIFIQLCDERIFRQTLIDNIVPATCSPKRKI